MFCGISVTLLTKLMLVQMLTDGAGGGSGIRTHDTVSRIHAFQASAFSHSAIPPADVCSEGPRGLFQVRQRDVSLPLSRDQQPSAGVRKKDSPAIGRGEKCWLTRVDLARANVQPR